MKYFLYVRKSSEQDERQALSISSQIRELSAKFSDLDIIEVLEEQHSAYEPHSRPVFEKMISRLQKSEAQGIIAWHPDRLSRNEVDAATITYMIRKNIILDLKFGSYYFDNSPEGVMMLQLALSQSQYFSSKLSKDIQRGNREKYQRGGISWTAPTGYLNNRETGILEPDPDRFELVCKMWEMLLSGMYTVPQIMRIANEEWGFTTIKRKRNGGSKLAQSVIYKMFANPLYCGLNIRPDGKVYECNHIKAVTEDAYWRVQMILGRKGRQRPQTHEFAYTGMIRCGECDCAVTAQEMYVLNKTNKKVRHYVHYRCTKKRKDTKCSQPYLNLKDLEEQIDGYLAKISVSQKYIDWMFKYLEKINDKETHNRGAVYRTQQKNLADIEDQLSELIKMRARKEIDAFEFENTKNELTSEKAKMKELVKDTELRAEQWFELAEKTINFVSRARYWFHHGTLHDKRLIFQTLSGSNALLKDKQLIFEPVKVFKPFENQPDNTKTPAELTSSWWN